ncbi:DUF814 domain-containing protein [Candidatus Bathyarchaeota archaeon]|nr:MAG: DUF814 domain-containing protein [Candidatus Bathyarchaeota archaeon]
MEVKFFGVSAGEGSAESKDSCMDLSVRYRFISSRFDFKSRRLNMKALGLLSGGLDSTLAVKLVQSQGVNIVGVNFTSPFSLCEEGSICTAVKQLGIPLETINLGNQYFKILRNPKYGYGKNMNPCIDCRIFMFKKAKIFAEKIQAAFIITGEVLNERPMSQNIKALRITEAEAGLEGRILRPLSAKLLPETEAEKQGWIDREKLLDIKGRSRKRQMQLAEQLGIEEYPTPSGGCLLTYKEFAAKIRDLLQHKKRIRAGDINLLRVGRHLRFNKNKIVVGRNEAENKQLERMRGKEDYLFEVPDCGSPITLLHGPKTDRTIRLAAALTLRYSDKKGEALVRFGREELTESILVLPSNALEIEKLRIK